MDKVSPIKNCLFINDLDKASKIFCKSILLLFDKTILDSLLTLLKGNLSITPFIEEGKSSGTNALLNRGFSNADVINTFLQVEAIVVSAQSSINFD